MEECGEIEVAHMQTNHRSTPEIIDAARMLAGHDAKGMEYGINKSRGEKPVLIDAITPEMELDAQMRLIAGWRKEHEDKEIAVLARKHSTLITIEREMRNRDIPCIVAGSKPDFLSGPELKAYTGFLKLAREPMRDDMLESIIDFPPSGIVTRTRYALRGNGVLEWDNMIAALSEPGKYRAQVIERINTILDLREEWEAMMERQLTPVEVAGRVAEESGIRDYLLEEGDYTAARALESIIAAAEEFRTFGEYVDYLEAETNRARSVQGITLSTIHNAKGREWDCVLIPNFDAQNHPLGKSDEIEERNLAFVALTRPRYRLAMTVNRREKPSIYLTGMPVQSFMYP
jgi:DNA helicase-2/ATP-dependent DNA helicase PcrA